MRRARHKGAKNNMRLSVSHSSWPIAGHFTISRGSKTSAEVVVAEITDGQHTARGECVPYARYGETIDNVIAAIEALAGDIAQGFTRADLQNKLPAGAARAALDCALWDLEAKKSGLPVWQLAGLPKPRPLITAYTISLDTPEAMAKKAAEARDYPLLKLKLGGTNDIERVAAIRKAAPEKRLIIDANEAWTLDDLHHFTPEFAALQVELIEQPLPAGADDALLNFKSPVPLCADESCHDTASLGAIIGRYEMVNIKLNKSGGLTEAIRLTNAAEAAGLKIMIGCMVGTSLAMAPAALLGAKAQVIDLDGPLLLTQDRSPGIRYDKATMYPPEPEVWG